MRTAIGVGTTAWFLFTDVEDSTQRWDSDPSGMVAALAQHDALIEDAVVRNEGRIVKHTGDGVIAVFDDADRAVHASVEAQLRLTSTRWPRDEPLRVRVGIHGGDASSDTDGWYRRGDDYVGRALNRCARVMAAARGGQVLCTQTVVDSSSATADPDLDFVDLGAIGLRGLFNPERIYQVTHARLPREFSPLHSRATAVGRLPVSDDELVGRSAAADEIADTLRRRRLVTLTGVAGVGKTRLALRVAELIADDFPDGVWFVPLAALTDPRLVADSVAHVMEIRERVDTTRAEALTTALATQRALIVIDNCEHLVDEVARFVTSVVTDTASVRFLATSRSRLDAVGEVEWPVPPLEVPATEQHEDDVVACAAVRLITERARAKSPDFTINAENVHAVAELCRRLDGVPLALELAASRIGTMSPEEILARLDERFTVLGVPRAHGRHATLREAIEWSYDLLDPDEQAVFRTLAVFSGAFSADDAAAITTVECDLDAVLEELTRKSVVDVAPDGRFRLLESLRDFAWDQLDAAGQTDATLDRHCDYYCTLVEGLANDIRGPRQAEAYERIDSALDNVRAAFDRLIEAHDGERALRLVRVLRTFWTELHTTEGFMRALDAVRAADDAPASARVGGLADVSWMAYIAGREDALALAHEAVELAEHAGIPADPEAFYTISLCALFAGHVEEALAGFERARDIAHATGDEYEIAAALTGTTILRAILGDVEGAITDGEECLARSRALGYDTQIAAALAVSGFAYGTKDPAHAVELLDESLAIKEDTTYSSAARVVAGHLQLLLGELAEAVTHFQSTLSFYDRLGDAFFVPTAIEGIAGACAAWGDPARAAYLLGIATMAREKLELPGLEIETTLRGLIEATVGDDHPDARAAGTQASLDEGIDAARATIATLLGEAR